MLSFLLNDDHHFKYPRIFLILLFLFSSLILAYIMFPIKKSIQHRQAFLLSQHLTRKNTINNNNSQLIARRQLSFWTIPKIILATTNKTNRKWIFGTLGLASALSSVMGPVVWVAAGGAASIVSWRMFKKTKSWWNYLAPVISSTKDSNGVPSLTETILSQIGTHRAAELVRVDAIKQLKNFFTTTDQGKQMLQEFGLDHADKLVWEEVHKSETEKIGDGKHKVKANFWLEDQTSKGPQGGGCEVSVSAIVTGEGKIDLEQVKLSAPGWHKDEIVPLSS